ncbi:cadherin EGF LAG seven-pass G-type receptor 1-like isoform X1 [Lates japonicus]
MLLNASVGLGWIYCINRDLFIVKGQTLANHVELYWPVVPPLDTDREEISEGGCEEVRLCVETRVNNQSAVENGFLPRSPDSSQQPMRPRGILKTKTPPPSYILHRLVFPLPRVLPPQ